MTLNPQHRWSKLQRALYRIMDPEIRFQIHCVAYRMNWNQWGRNHVPRYWITIGKEIVWDYPQDFTLKQLDDENYPYGDSIQVMSRLIREYVDCSSSDIFREFPADKWNLIPVLRVCDRRVGKRRLSSMFITPKYERLRPIISKRLHEKKYYGT